MTDIKFIKDHRDLLIDKINIMQDKFTNLCSDISNELRDIVTTFSQNINIKLKYIDEKYQQQQTELENLKTELKTKQFDESNFNNVSIIKNQSKQITEKDTKIKELETKIRNLSQHITPISSPTSIPTTEHSSKIQPILLNNIETPTEEIVETVIKTVKPKQIRNSTIKKKQISMQIQSNDKQQTQSFSDIEIKEVEPINKLINNSMIDSLQTVTKDNNTDNNTDEEELRLAEELEKRMLKDQADKQPDILITPIVKKKSNIDKKVVYKTIEKTNSNIIESTNQEVSSKKEVVSSDVKVVGKKVINTKVDSKKEVVNNDVKVDSKKEVVNSDVKVDSKKEVVNSDVKVDVKKEVVNSDIKVDRNKEVVYPEELPDITCLDVLELDGNDYYKDKTNNNVYQIINGDDIGIFLGVYDNTTSKIMPLKS